MLRVDTGNPGMQEDTTVAGGFGLELEAQIEVAIGLFGGQVAVLVGGAFAKDGASFNNSFFFTVVFPPGQVCPVEERSPAAFRWRLSDGAEPKGYQGCEEGKNFFHGEASVYT
jgi:hypothetical protein